MLPIGARGLMRRRILLNFRLRPDLLTPLLPPVFRPRLVHGWALIGICAIQLEHLRPDFGFLPARLGLPPSDNVAHRVAVEWTDPRTGRINPGVYIPRRDTDSCLIARAGGRLLPSGLHGLAQFRERLDADGSIHLRITDSKGLLVAVAARPTVALSPTSCFASLNEASDFFASGSAGYSFGRASDRLEGVALETERWAIEPLHLEHVYARDLFYAFPPGSLEFDSALLMRDIEHRWHPLPPLARG